jgi:hypothetical protein
MLKLLQTQLLSRLKHYSWLMTLSTIFVCLLATICHGAESNFVLEINFSFDTQNIEGKEVSGYRLYMEGDLVCETEQVEQEQQKIECSIISEPGTYNFTLSILYNDNSESPQSPPFPFALVLKGDINGDNALTLEDAIIALQVVMGLTPAELNTAAAVDKDGKIGLKEVVYCLKNI